MSCTSPSLNFAIQIDNPGSYTVWARGMAPDAGGDSLHVGVDGGTPSTAANLTGFTPNQWSWSRLTMSNTNATVDLNSSGTFTLNVSMREDGLRLDKLMLVTDTATIPTGQGSLESPITNTLPTLNNQFITYEYDPLYRLTEAVYSGTFSGTYQYQYDALGNRKTYTTTMTATAVTTYQYDAANRLLQSDIQGGDTTIYDWDNASRLITTTVASAISRVYGYSQDGDLLSALVDGQTTTFLYDGNGNRLQMTVGSEVTTYTLDYGRGFQLLMEQGGAFATIKHYLYGLECIGELIDADIPASKEWRYYQRDGNSLVRQTTNEQEDITLAWTFSPEGAVVLGEEGPVTRLDCGSNAVYDWSTGLIFKNGRYFDPRTGIWITLVGMIVWQTFPKPSSSKKRRSRRRSFLLALFVILVQIGCTPAPLPTETPCPTSNPVPSLPTGTPFDLLPPPVITSPIAAAPPTSTTIPTSAPLSPTNTPVPPSATPNVPPSNVMIFGQGQTVAVVTPFNDPSHLGLDIVPSSKNNGGDDAAGTPVYALQGGFVVASTYEITVLDNQRRFEISYSHVNPEVANGTTIAAGTRIATINSGSVPDPLLIKDENGVGLAHVHLNLKVPPGYGNEVDPYPLISS